jgi:hypothetical protein
MTLETYTATLKHDTGKKRLSVVSLNGEQGAVKMIMAIEHCPKCAIMKIKKVKIKVV